MERACCCWPGGAGYSAAEDPTHLENDAPRRPVRWEQAASAWAFSAPGRLTFLQLHGHEAQVTTGLDAHQDGLAPELGCLLDARGDIVRALHRQAANLQDDVAGLNTLLRRIRAAIHLGHDHAFLVGARGRGDAEAELIHLGCLRLLAGLHFGNLFAARELSELDGDGLLFLAAQDLDVDLAVGIERSDFAGQVAAVVDVLPVDG